MFDPSNYNLTPGMGTGVLLDWISAYRQICEKLSGQVQSADATKAKTVKDAILKDETVNGFMVPIVDEIRTLVFDSLFANPAVAVPMFDALQAIKDDVKTLRDWHVEKVAKNVRIEMPDNIMDAEMIEAAKEMRSFIENMFKMFSTVQNPAMGFDSEEWAKVPTKQTRKGSENVKLDLPAIPGTVSREGAGRSAELRITQFFVNGETVPAGTHLRDVLMTYCSDSKHIFTTTWVIDEIKRTHPEEVSKNLARKGTEWEITLPNGIKLAGLVPEDDDSEDDDSE